MKFLNCLLLLPLFLIATRAQENSICGHIKSGQLTIPSYKFTVVDINGNPVKGLKAEGTLTITEGVWNGTGIMLIDVFRDPYWETHYHNISIPTSYDTTEEVYVSKALSSVTIARRNKGSVFHPNKCWDKAEKIDFTFRDEASSTAFFVFFFDNKKLAEINLPDSSLIRRLELHDKWGKRVPAVV